MKYIKPIFLCILTGIILGLFLYSGYEKKKDILPVFLEGEKVSFIRLGTYSSMEQVEQNTASIPNYIYLNQGGKYQVYIGITIQNVDKIKEYFKAQGYVVDVDVFQIQNKEFLKILKEYDQLLLHAEDTKVIENIITGIITKYEELIKDD